MRIASNGPTIDDQGRGGLSRRSFLALAGAGGAAVGVSALGNRYAFATPACSASVLPK